MLTPKLVDTVGVDLGVKTLATLSTGEVFEGAKAYNSFEAKLSRLQYLNRKKTIRSKNWQTAQLQIAKLHRRIANIRKDTLHKLTLRVRHFDGTETDTAEWSHNVLS